MVEWTGLEWNGMEWNDQGRLDSVEWNGGMERWNGIVEWWNTGTVE